MDKIEAALEVLFAENYADLKSSFDASKIALVLGMSERWDFMTNHWYELRHAAKTELLATLRRVPVAAPPSDTTYVRLRLTFVGSDIINCVKIIRMELGLGLRDSKNFVVDRTPSYLEIRREVAIALMEKLAAIGVRASID